MVAAAASPPAVAADPLPDGRAYELVSPYDTDGADILGGAVFPANGNRAMIFSLAFFAGHPNGVIGTYTVDRTPAQWVPKPIAPLDDRTNAYIPVDATEDASRIFVQPQAGLLGGGESKYQSVDADGTRTDLVTLPSDFSTSWAARSLNGRAFVTARHPLVPAAPPFDEGETHIYEVTGGVPRLVSLDENGDPLDCGAALGDGTGSGGNGRSLQQTGISADGRTVAYTTAFSCDTPVERTVYVNRNGDVTDVSTPEAPEANLGATFLGMDAAGTQVFLLTASKLEPGDDNGVADVYRYTPASGAYQRISADGADDDANVSSAIVSGDGSHVYFTTDNALGGEGADGSRNLFVWSGGAPRFVVTSANMGPLEGTSSGSATVTPDGRHLLFWSSDPLTPPYSEADPPTPFAMAQIYRYDADEDALDCVSCPPDGSQPSGTFGLQLGQAGSVQISGTRTQSDDGRFVIFLTRDRLLPADRNEKLDLYEWREDGRLFLISTGVGVEDVGSGGISSDGRDILFTTSERLVPGLDQDNVKLYDARIGGGQPAPAAPPARPDCTGDECQGKPAPQPAEIVPGSAVMDGSTNRSEADRALRVGSLSRAALRRAARTGRLRVAVTVAQAGRVRASLKARVRGRNRTIASASRSVREPGRTTLTLRLSRPARRALARRGLRATLRVTAPGATPESRNLALPRR